MITLSPKTETCIRRTFPESAWRDVEECLLNECGDNLPAVEVDYDDLAERIRFAVIKLSGGNYFELKHEVEKAKQDWRDVLMTAGFGEGVTAHLNWEASHE
jgi:hypothetical protein